MTNLDTIARKTAELIDKAPQSPRPISDAMVADYPMMREIALYFVAGYKGTNSFVQDIAVKLADTGNLSIPQMRGALNVMIAEARLAKRQEIADMKEYARDYGDPSGLIETFNTPTSTFHIDMQPNTAQLVNTESDKPSIDDVKAMARANVVPVTNVMQIPNGTYTVPINEHGEYSVIKLTDCPEKYNKPAGTQIAAYQFGPDNERDFTGFAFVIGTAHQVWSKFRKAQDCTFALTKLLTLGKAQEFGKLWAMASQRCYICGRKLTTPDSKAAGIGPICAGNNGISMAAMILMGTQAAAIEENDMRDAQAKIDELFPD